MNSTEVFMVIRLVLHLSTVVLLASYCRPNAKFRLGPSVMAGLLLSSSASLAAHMIFNWEAMARHDPQPQFVLFVFTVFLPVAWARGNVAKIYDGLHKYSPSRWRHDR